MKARIIALTALLLLTVFSFVPAIAQDKQSSVSSTETTTITTASDKEKEDKDRQAKLEAEYKARAEAEKKKHAEERQQKHDQNQNHDGKHQPDSSANAGHGTSDNHSEKPSASPVAPPSSAVTSATVQNQQTSQHAVPSTDTTTTTTTATDKEKEDKDRQKKLEAEYKARAEAEKRERVEERKERQARHYEYNGGSSASMSMSSGFFDDPFARSSIGLVVAPSNSIGKAAVGLQWISKNKWGIALWNSGSAEDDDVIDTYIPHDDYYTKSDQASYSCEALYGIGTNTSMLILGAGISIEKTNYTNVSNITGWEWKGWSDSTTKFAGQVGYRARISDRIGLQFGYDTTQYTYFGVTASF